MNDKIEKPLDTQKSGDPRGELSIRTIAMPGDTNPNGDIFGGWIVSQMDMAGHRIAQKRSHSRCVTVSIHTISFLAPVAVGDYVCCYCRLDKVGRTSMHVHVEVWAMSPFEEEHIKVTEGMFVYVATDAKGKPHAVDQ